MDSVRKGFSFPNRPFLLLGWGLFWFVVVLLLDIVAVGIAFNQSTRATQLTALRTNVDVELNESAGSYRRL